MKVTWYNPEAVAKFEKAAVMKKVTMIIPKIVSLEGALEILAEEDISPRKLTLEHKGDTTTLSMYVDTKTYKLITEGQNESVHQ